MSGQSSNITPARVLKSSPISGKQGPLKATLPMSSLLKQNSNIKTNGSPTQSPTSFWKTRISPDHSSGQRSPGSCVYKVKSKAPNNGNGSTGNTMRRTVSLDAIYLKGHWPRDNFYWHTGTLQVDKATQTDEYDWLEYRKILNSDGEETFDKLVIRQRLRNKDSNSKDHTLTASSQTSTSCIISPMLKASPVTIPLKPISKISIRSSIEGLNQEIERLVLRTSSGYCSSNSQEGYDKFRQVTPEGHRAPLAELFRTTRSRSVNTQTPTDCEPMGSSCHLSGPPSQESLSPLYPRLLDSPYSDTGGSQGSSPDQEGGRLGTSPHINRFLAREPPDGCEKVHLKLYDEKTCIPLEHTPQPRMFKLKPSLGSAFQIPQPNSHISSDRDLPIVPSQHNI